MYDIIKTHYCATSVTTDFLCDFIESENNSKECDSLYLDGGWGSCEQRTTNLSKHFLMNERWFWVNVDDVRFDSLYTARTDNLVQHDG